MDRGKKQNEPKVRERSKSALETRGGKDLAIALSVGLANAVVLLLCWRTVGVQSDESINIYGALRILDGDRIYRDFWVYHTPGVFFLTAAVFAVFGKSILAIRIALILAASGTASALYLLGRKFMGALPSALASLLFVMAGVNLWPVAGYHWHSTVTLVFATLMTARFVQDRSRRKSLFAGGFLAGATFMFQQPKGGYLLCLMFLFLVADEVMQKERSPLPGRMLKTVFIFTAGACAPLIAAAAYFACVGTLGHAVSATIVYPIRLLAQAGGETGYGRFYGSLTERVLASLAGQAPLPGSGSTAAAVLTFVFKFAAPLSIFATAAVWIVRRLRGKEENAIPLLCAAVGLAAFGSALQRPDFYHLLTILAPCYLTLVYVLSSIASEAPGAALAAPRKVTALLLGAALVLSCARVLVGELVYASSLRTVSLGSPLGFASAPGTRAEAAALWRPLTDVVDFIRLNTAPNDKIFVMSFSPFLYYLSGRENPTPYIDIPSSPCMGEADVHVFKLGDASLNMERLESAARALDADKTPVVVLDPAAACQVRPGWDEADYGSEPLIDYIRRNYSIRFDNGVYVIMTRSERGAPAAGAAPRTGLPPPPRSR